MTLLHRWDDVEADLACHYGADLRRLGVRRCLAYVTRLPAGSRTFGGDGWTIDRELAASTLELVYGVLIATLGSYGVKPHKWPPAPRIPRPAGMRSPGASSSPLERLTAFAQALQGGR